LYVSRFYKTRRAARAKYGGMTMHATGSIESKTWEYVVRGRIGRRQGSFVLQATGSSGTDGASRGRWSVIEGSATEDLVGLQGAGEFTYQAGQQSSLTLDYDFA